MKKFYSFLFAAVALVGFAACNSDSTEEPAPAQQVGKMEFTANIGEDTKTALDGLDVIWCKGDTIGIWDGTATKPFIAKETDGKSAKFTGMADPNQKTYYAVYPYVKGATYADGVWKGVNFNNNQEAKAGSFACKANISYAESEGTTLNFQNSLAVLKFQVPVECELVEFVANSALLVKAWAPADKKMQPEKDYYVTVPAGNYQLTARVDGYLSVASTKMLKVDANKIYNLKTLPAPEAEAKTTVYLVPGVWNVDKARFAAYVWYVGGYKWYEMTAVAEKEGVYTCEIPANADGIIFGRVNPAFEGSLRFNTEEENKTQATDRPIWNQTADLTVPADKARYCIAGWDKSGYWEKVLYLVPNSNWKRDNARFAVALLNSDKSVTDWCDMTKVSGQSYYEVYFRVDKNYKYVIYCRMNPGTTENKWENKWDQTNDLEIPTNVNNCYTVKSGTWSYGGGTWSKK